MSTKNPAHRPPETPDEEIPARDVTAGMWVFDRARGGYLAVEIARPSPWVPGQIDLFFRGRRRKPKPTPWQIPAGRVLRVRRPS